MPMYDHPMTLQPSTPSATRTCSRSSTSCGEILDRAIRHLGQPTAALVQQHERATVGDRRERLFEVETGLDTDHVRTRTERRVVQPRPVRNVDAARRLDHASDSSQASCRRAQRPPWRQQLDRRAVLDHASVVDHEHAVGDLHRREAVGDDERRPVLQDDLERLLDQPLRRHVDGRRRLVEDDHRRVGDERARQRDELLLTGRQPSAALPDVAVVALGQRGDEAVRADDGRRAARSPRASRSASRTRCCRRRSRRTGSSPASPSRSPCAARSSAGRAGRRRRS